jgi:hypothetical protein
MPLENLLAVLLTSFVSSRLRGGWTRIQTSDSRLDIGNYGYRIRRGDLVSARRPYRLLAAVFDRSFSIGSQPLVFSAFAFVHIQVAAPGSMAQRFDAECCLLFRIKSRDFCGAL